MELEKVGKLDLNEEPYLQPISNRGIGFYNLDKNTAKFQFVVQKDNKPLLISDKNVKGYAFFKATNGTEEKRPSTSGVLDVEFIDPMKGLIGVTVPQWFLKNVVDSEVLGEIYLSLNDVNNVGKDDTVVLGTFKFTVRDSLINQIESDIKVSYIRMFDELRSELEKKVQQLKQDIGDTQTLIETIRQTAEDYLIKINKAQADAIVSITDALMSSNESIDLEREEALRQIDAKRDAIKTEYDLASDTFKKTYDSNVDAFNSNVNQANATIDEKINAFNGTLENDGFTTPAYVEQKFTEANWQKHKLTNDDGTNFYDADLQVDFDDGEQLINLSIGTRYVVRTSNNPDNTNSNGWLTKYERKSGVMLIRYQPYNSTVIYQKRFYNGWSEWERVGSDVVDTGWIDLQLVNSASPHNDLVSKGGFTSAYRTITQNGVTKKMLRINATTIKHGQTIALLPKEFVKNLMFFSISAPRNKNSGRISLNTSGTVNFDATVDPSAWTDTDYIYGQYEWTE
ncbi:BppU family phage baseplate upper protein [Staphylococcus epidermidis]|nr:BppU family phage baseplate upper protein [Staphylococcus epidermidis]MDH8813653.1 BppU family phage baseplate upper protein [Staphylococcus epidermidis]MDH8904756.1 BppU family phage baseplate upper protein [Staphylococcus epidermidis]MDH8905772.1 BppU family phage baseplate upper protein [Staphylococcus epidermidis]MDH8911572.1 BppU family phage baseplate upper protein [Staphylococcus epidermidis]